MGSYQREWSDKIEEDVCVNNNIIPSGNNFSVCDAFSEDLTFEIKASSDENFKFNTLANIGQNSLTDYNIFNCIPWKDFRNSYFSIEKDKLSNGLSMANIRDNFPNIKNQIENLSLEDKLNYIKLLSESSVNGENLRIFVLNCLLGTCKKGHYKKEITEEDLLKSNFIFVNSTKEEKIVNKKTIFEEIDFNNLHFLFEKGNTSIKICDSISPILRICFHWKNKFQGGETPCLNIFLSSRFKINK